MFLTNNIETYYNLTLYSNGIYRKRNLNYDIIFPTLGLINYRNIKPFGNINKPFKIFTSDLLYPTTEKEP